MYDVFNMILNWINHDLTIRPVRRIVPCQIQCSQDMIAQALKGAGSVIESTALSISLLV